jgi:hypothetical protein
LGGEIDEPHLGGQVERKVFGLGFHEQFLLLPSPPYSGATGV